MNLKLTLAAAITTGLMCGTAMAQTHSPNPNKAQNSEMRTQSGGYPYALYPDGTRVSPGTVYVYPSDSPSTVWVVPAPAMSEPTAGRRTVYVPIETNTPALVEYDMYYIYPTDRVMP